MNIEQNNKNIKSHSTHKKIFLNHLTLPIFYLIIGNNSINKMRFGRISLEILWQNDYNCWVIYSVVMREYPCLSLENKG